MRRARLDVRALGRALRQARPRLPLLGALLLAIIVHWRLLESFFFSDDYLHLYHAVVDSFPRFLLRTHGFHLLGVWRAVFWVYDGLFGLRAELWFAAVLATHLLNVGLLYGTLSSLTGRVALAGCASALWGISPIARGSLGWLSAYPHVLLTTWVLWTLYDVVRVARGQLKPSSWVVLRWLLLMLMAVNSFGIGVGIAMAFPFACALLLWSSEERRKILLPTFGLVVVVPVQFVCLTLVAHEPVLMSLSWSQMSGWTMLLGTLSMAVELVMYGIAIVIGGSLLALAPLPEHSVVAGPLAGMPLETARPLIVLLALVVGVGMAVRLYRGDARTRRDVLAFVLLALACYTPVALGRRALTLGIEAWLSPRYHYLGPALIWLAICPVLAGGPGRVRLRRGLAAAALAWLGLVTIWSLEATSAFTRSRSDRDWRPFERALAAIEERILEAPRGQTAYLPNRNHPIGFMLGKKHFPGWAAVFVIVRPDDEFEGRLVRFVEQDQEVLAAARRDGGERMRDLLVSPDEVPRHSRRLLGLGSGQTRK